MATWCINSEKIIGKYDFPYHFKKIFVRYKKISYNIAGGFLLLRIFGVCISVNPRVCFILDLILISMFLR